MTMAKTLVDSIDTEIDETTLEAVLQEISDLCSARADDESDEESAAQWEAAAAAIWQVSKSSAVIMVS